MQKTVAFIATVSTMIKEIKTDSNDVIAVLILQANDVAEAFMKLNEYCFNSLPSKIILKNVTHKLLFTIEMLSGREWKLRSCCTIK